MKRFMGEGLIFSESKVWKMKRTVLNKVFNFDLIKSLASKIEVLCDSVLDNLEKQFSNEKI